MAQKCAPLVQDQNTLAILAALNSLGASIAALALIPAQNIFTGDGVTQDFTLSHAPALRSVNFVTDGATPQVEGVDYTISGTTLHFAVAPANGNILVSAYQYAPA